MSIVYSKKFSFSGRLKRNNSSVLVAEIKDSDHDTYVSAETSNVWRTKHQVEELLQKISLEISERSSTNNTYLEAALKSKIELKTALDAFNNPNNFLDVTLNRSNEHSVHRMGKGDGVYSTEQQTSKSIKGQTLIAYALGLFGGVLVLISFGAQSTTIAIVGCAMLVIAIIWRLVLRFRTWWEHG